MSFNTASGKYYCNMEKEMVCDMYEGFNTASGKYYCNCSYFVATWCIDKISFNTASGKYYCNIKLLDINLVKN